MAKKASRTREARQRRQKQRRQSRWTVLLLAIVIVAVMAVAVIVVSNQPVEAHILPDLTERYEDISRSFSLEGYPQLGDLDAPVTLEEYASFACPGCEALHSDSFDAILDRVREGQVSIHVCSHADRFDSQCPRRGKNCLVRGAGRVCSGRCTTFFSTGKRRYANTA